VFDNHSIIANEKIQRINKIKKYSPQKMALQKVLPHNPHVSKDCIVENLPYPSFVKDYGRQAGGDAKYSDYSAKNQKKIHP
jgi:biotin synthase-related radical SAM superfamily protein